MASNNKYDNLFCYGNVANKFDDAACQISTSKISNPKTASDPRTDDKQEIWKDLKASQDPETVISTDLELLRKDVADLKTKNTHMYKALVSLKSENEEHHHEVEVLQQKALIYELKQGKQPPESDLSETKQLQMVQADMTALREDMDKLVKEMTVLREDMDKLVKEMTVLPEDMDKLVKEMTVLPEDMDKLVKEMTVLREDMDKLVKEMTVLREDMDKLVKEMTVLREDMDKLVKEMKVLQAGNAQRQEEYQNLKPWMTSLKTKIERLAKAVAFTVDLSENLMLEKGTLICDIVLTNVGEGYDSETGAFTAPIAELYLRET